jgi:hypothetical protein
MWRAGRALAVRVGRIDRPWQPRLVGRVNDTDVKVVKLQGE